MELSRTYRLQLLALSVTLAATLIALPRITNTSYYIRYLWFWENSYQKFDFQRIILEWVLILFLLAIYGLASPILRSVAPAKLRPYLKTAAVSAVVGALFGIVKFL